MGIYNDFIRLNVEDVGECRILVQYVEAGKNPKLEIEFFEEMVFGYYNDYWDYSRYKNMNIYNKGDGILFWQIISCPAWLNIGTSPQSGIVAPQYMANTITFFLTEDKNLLPIKKTFDTIIIQSNDEKSPIYKIPVFYRTVAPKMGYSLWAAYFDNNIRTTYFGIVNDGGEILEWEFTSYPQWINISQTKGNLKQGERIDLSMTAENDNFTEYITYGEITLISNDVNNLFRRIPVEYHNYP
ncbi:hypothetical protein FACS18945_1210 [Bacteroidia bacterium]|nr:hypothetical protein FACS18945_1210 [Bacteroidia bacterium]